jgi:hypothetical protein
MKRNILSSKKYYLLLMVILNVLFAVHIVNGATYYSRGTLAPNVTGSWRTNPDGSGSQPANFTTAGDIFVIQNGHSMAMSANWSVTGNIVINDGGTLTTGPRTITISGTTTIGSGTSGTLNINSTTGSKNFYGLVTINSGANWNNSVNETVTFRGGIANYGTFNAGTGTHTFNTSAQTISGTISIPRVSVPGIILTNSGNLTVGTALTGTTGTLTNNGTLNIGGTCSIGTTSGGLNNSGTLNRTGTGSTTTPLARFINTGIINLSGSGSITGITNNAGGIVNLTNSGTITSFNNATPTSVLNIDDLTVPTITTLTATAAGNTVNYSGNGNQTAKVTVYSNLTLSGSGTKSFATTPTVNGILSMEGTASVVVTTGAVTYGTDAILQYNKPTGYTVTLEEFPATFSGTGGVQILNTGTITFGAAKVITNNLSIASVSSVNLGTFAHDAGSLTLGGSSTVPGSWGSSSSPAVNQNDVFFASATGVINVASGICLPPSPPSVITSAQSVVCLGSSVTLSVTDPGAGLTTDWFTGSCEETPFPGGTATNSIIVSPVSTTTYYAKTRISSTSNCYSLTCSSANITLLNPVSPLNSETNVSANATLNWNSIPGATGYNLYFGTDALATNIENGTDLGNMTSYTPSVNLSLNTDYYWKVIPYNSEGNIIDCSTWTFSTLSYCSAGSTSPELYESITNVTFAGINNSTPAIKTLGYADFTSSVASGNVVQGQNYPFSVTVTFQSGQFTGYCKLYIDYDQSGTFDTPEELAYESAYNGNITMSGTISVPVGASLGSTRMRVVLQGDANSSGALPCSSFTWGEVEDYTIEIIPQCTDASLTLNTANDIQTICELESIEEIEFSAGGDATGANITGLPNGVTGIYNAGIVIISGTPTESGEFIFTVTTTGTPANCSEATASGTITVIALPEITVQPSPLALCEGDDGSFIISTSAISPDYQWQYATSPTSETWDDVPELEGITGTNNSELQLTNILLTFNGYYVSCRIKENGCESRSIPVLLTVNPLPDTGEIIPD